MGEAGAWQSDERIAPGLHMSRQRSEHGDALGDAGEGKPSNRRITADSFRLLTARLKKRPTAFADPTPPPEPIVPAPIEIFHENIISAPLEEVEPEAEFSSPDPVLQTPEASEVVTKKPWAWLTPADPVEAPAFDPPPEIETAVSAVEEAEPIPEPEPWAEIPFEELFAAPAPAQPEPEVVAPEPELISAEPEPAPPEPETAAPEPAVVSLEPKAAAPAPEMIAPEPAAVLPQENIEKTVTAGEKTEPAGETPQARRRSQVPNGKLGDNHLPVSGVEVPGIGDIAKAIYMTPTPADRTAFLAEVAAMAAAEATWEKAKANLASIIHTEQAAPAKPQVRRVKPVDDPFAKLDLEEPSDTAAEQPDEDAGELARSLLDMMLSNPSAGQPQERALAADALLKLVPRIPLRSLVTIVDRLSIMESPPHLLVSKLIHDPRIEVAGPLLELCNHISDQVLGKVIATGQVSLLRLIARRRHISAAMSDQLIEFDDPSVILTLVRNSGAAFSHHAFPRLADHAQRHHAVLAPFATRPDLPAPIAFELFWFVPAELRRYLLSRFLTDSETLTKILKITHAMGGGEQGMETKFPEREQIETFIEFLSAGNLSEATNLLAEIAAIQPDNAARIISDAMGEPLSIAMKAIGTNRARFGEIIEILKNSDFGIIAAERNTAELQNIFDSMSFNKARVLLTYWDWAVLKSGPYAPAN
jgi:hypothetical protein